MSARAVMAVHMDVGLHKRERTAESEKRAKVSLDPQKH